LVYGGRFSVPKGARHLSVNRLVHLMKMTCATIYRTACTLQYDDHIFRPMGTLASDIRITSKFTVLEDESSFSKVAQEEVNQKYDIKDPAVPLWNIHIVGPKEMLGDGITIDDSDLESYTFPKFYIFWSFHHCISDGLSGWCFIRAFLSNTSPEAFQKEEPNAAEIVITSNPPPLIDNLITANFIELIPGLTYISLPKAYVDAFFQLFAKSRFKPYRLKNLITEKIPLDIVAAPQVDPPTASRVHFFSFDEVFAEELRLNCRKNKTTIASAVIVAALAAIRNVFTPRAEKIQKKMPSYQAWVVTSSIRMLIPGSKLLEGADKEEDPALMEFGSYGGSIANECFKFGKKNDLWERSRSVKRHLSGSFLKSIRRVKLMNFLFRRPKLWAKLQGKLDIDDITRSYSVEVANLGSWKCPYAPHTIRKDLVAADWFAGTLNNSFQGARALFTVALISINNVMSFTVSYDVTTISASEGELFVQGVTKALEQMKSSSSGKILISQLDCPNPS
jgi:hypothetical protein